MTHFTYPLASGQLGPEELEAAIDSLRSGRYTMGEKVSEFENALAEWIGVKHAVMVNSGSSANLLLVDSLLRRTITAPLQPGDEVLVPALAWPTTVAPIIQLGLVPVYCDIDPITLALDLKSAEQVISRRTKAMFLIHVLGRACAMNPYLDFCDEHDLVLIEDCCESFGAFDAGRHVGTFGCGGTLSHYYSHHLTTLEGGTIITNDGALADDLRSTRSHGWIRSRSDAAQKAKDNPLIDPRFCFILPGYNVRPLELQAAIGIVQLDKMDDQIHKRELMAYAIRRQFSPDWITVPGMLPKMPWPPTRASRNHSWMMIPFMVAEDAPTTAAKAQDILQEAGVDTRPIIAGNLAHHPMARYGTHRTPMAMPVADSILNRGFMIGCHPDSTAEQLECLEAAFALLKGLGTCASPTPAAPDPSAARCPGTAFRSTPV